MAYDPDKVLRRDNRLCRLRFPGCTKHASRVMLDIPEYLGGACTDNNALAACGHCWQRTRAAELFNYIEGWT